MKEITLTFLRWSWSRRTTILGDAQTVLGVLATSTGIFGDGTLKWIILTNGILTSLLGRYNNRKIRQGADDADAASGV